MEGTPIRVCIRTSPLISSAKGGNAQSCLSVKENVATLLNQQGQPGKVFKFEHCYWSSNSTDDCYADQESIFNNIGLDVLTSARRGYNATVFCYGQTGSGKTYTMMGTAEQPGLVPRIAKELFISNDKVATGRSITISFMEVYKEKIWDLLTDSVSKDCSTAGTNLTIVNTKSGVEVNNLTTLNMCSYSDVLNALNFGNTRRHTAITAMNKESSRSHAILCITYRHAVFEAGAPRETTSKIYLVDLAGSERASKSELDAARLKESKFINCSLTTLGKVIRALNKQSRNKSGTTKVHIPYRDSVLTRLLQDSLGGNSATHMIATVSPCSSNYQETLSTLQYASEVRHIKTRPKVNEDLNVKLIRDLRVKIQQLSTKGEDSCSESDDDDQLTSELCQTVQQEKHLTRQWRLRWRATKHVLKSKPTIRLDNTQAGEGVLLGCLEPHLVVLEATGVEEGVMLYHLTDGTTHTIGTHEDNTIVIACDGMLPHHCSITVSAHCPATFPRVTLSPATAHAVCAVNTELLQQPTDLQHGSLLLLGEECLVRFNNPAQARHSIPSPRHSLSRLSFQLINSSLNNSRFEASEGASPQTNLNSMVSSTANDLQSTPHKDSCPLKFSLLDVSCDDDDGSTPQCECSSQQNQLCSSGILDEDSVAICTQEEGHDICNESSTPIRSSPDINGDSDIPETDSNYPITFGSILSPCQTSVICPVSASIFSDTGTDVSILEVCLEDSGIREGLYGFRAELHRHLFGKMYMCEVHLTVGKDFWTIFRMETELVQVIQPFLVSNEELVDSPGYLRRVQLETFVARMIKAGHDLCMDASGEVIPANSQQLCDFNDFFRPRISTLTQDR